MNDNLYRQLEQALKNEVPNMNDKFYQSVKDLNHATDLDHAKEVVATYETLLAQALKVVSDVPFYSDINHSNSEGAALTFDGEDAVLSWSSYESDYYGGGYISRDKSIFPANALFLSDAELADLRKKVKQEEAEKTERLHRAQEAVARDRQEAKDRAEFARLSAKYALLNRRGEK